MENNIEVLKEITDKLPPIMSIENLKIFSKDGYVEFNVKEGSSFSLLLHNTDQVSVGKIYLSKGTIFPNINDPVSKTIVIIEGLIKVDPCLRKKKIWKEDLLLKPGDCIHFEPEEQYRGIVLEDTWIISVSVPKSNVYK